MAEMDFGIDLEDEVANASVVTDEVAEGAEEVVTEKPKRDPLAKYNALNPENKASVDEIVASVTDALGGADNVDLDRLLGVLDKLNALKKEVRTTQKEQEKERKEIAKAEAEAFTKKVGKLSVSGKLPVKADDTIDYYMATAKVQIIGAKVLKITEKSVRVDVTADTKVIWKGQETTAGNVSGLKLGAKSVAFAKVQKVNGEDFKALIA